jgi:AAA15 family ATPase/GTPase
MLKLFIHAENFTLFHEKQTWEIGRLNFLVGELATGKSSLIKLLELFPLNDQEMKEVKRFTSFSPYANFKNLVNDFNKPLKIAFEMHSEIGIYHQTYEFKPAQNEREAVLANFPLIYLRPPETFFWLNPESSHSRHFASPVLSYSALYFDLPTNLPS